MNQDNFQKLGHLFRIVKKEQEPQQSFPSGSNDDDYHSMRSFDSTPLNKFEPDQTSNPIHESYLVRVIEFDRIKSYKV